jgi:hypothetical protein
VKKYQRTLSEDEKRRLKRSLPWFGHRKQERLREIEQGLVDVYEFDIERTWDINGCRPPCCPYTLLFKTTDGLFVYIESWQEIERHNNESGESSLTIESAPAAKRLFKTAIEGEQRVRHSEKLREFNEFFEIAGDAEWQMYKREELPDIVLAALEAV